MAITHGYATLAQVRDQLGDTASAITASILEDQITAVSRAVDQWCGRRFWADSTATVRLYDVADRVHGDVVDVDDISSSSGVAVAIDGTGDGSAYTTITTYRLEPLTALQDGLPARSLRILSGSWPSYPGTVRVTALHGWPAVPAEVTQATILRVASLYARRNSPDGVRGVGDFGVVRISQRDPDVISLLEPFRVLLVGS